MTGRYKAYPEYKESGVDWLKEVPVDWYVSKLKRYCQVTDGSHHSPKIEVDGKPFISVTDVGEDFIDFESAKKISTDDYIRLVREGCKPRIGDILLTKDGTIGRACVVKKEMPDFVILSSLGLLTPSTLILETYLYYYLISGINIDQMNSLIHGSALRRMTISKIDDLIICFPEINEQQKIANFLDHETAKIDTLITKQEKLIELLKEKRQAVISHAVTKGLNPDAPMKDSGVEWLGEVPEHWGVTPLKYLCSFSGGGTPTKDNLSYWTDGTVPWVSPKDMKTERITQTTDYITEQAVHESSTNFVEAGALLMVVRSGILQRAIPVSINDVTVTLNQDMKALNFNLKMNADFALSFITGNQKALLLEWSKEGATVESIEHEYLANGLFPVPPIDEQLCIGEYLLKKMNMFGELEAKATGGIKLLKERKTALISAAVTGKIDVRDWQGEV
ncbi:restriction endonuclease subunit S [Vibrio splendidus]|uniref:Restriction endonuclease subunit S n=1 Tax=Vibrio splendidus TaxID=29497 RepID=A0A2T5F0W8_VIBSP|nr:restriction endonuclease subunit S [Vibrio splendidus]PTP39368.1 restriction endonuclease subunit S [Vibrio splendidus]